MVEHPASLRRYQVNASAWPIEQFLDRPSGAAKFDMDQPYQRGLVWGTKRKQNLVKSILMGVPVPSIVPNNRLQAEFNHAGYDQARNWMIAVVDGKQRVTAIREFLADQYPVPASWFEDGAPGETSYSKLARRNQQHILNLPLAVSVGHFATLADEQELFDLINFGGLAQGETDDEPVTAR